MALRMQGQSLGYRHASIISPSSETERPAEIVIPDLETYKHLHGPYLRTPSLPLKPRDGETGTQGNEHARHAFDDVSDDEALDPDTEQQLLVFWAQLGNDMENSRRGHDDCEAVTTPKGATESKPTPTAPSVPSLLDVPPRAPGAAAGTWASGKPLPVAEKPMAASLPHKSSLKKGSRNTQSASTASNGLSAQGSGTKQPRVKFDLPSTSDEDEDEDGGRNGNGNEDKDGGQQPSSPLPSSPPPFIEQKQEPPADEASHSVVPTEPESTASVISPPSPPQPQSEITGPAEPAASATPTETTDPPDSTEAAETAEPTEQHELPVSPARHMPLSGLRARLDTMWRTKLLGPSKKAKGKRTQPMLSVFPPPSPAPSIATDVTPKPTTDEVSPAASDSQPPPSQSRPLIGNILGLPRRNNTKKEGTCVSDNSRSLATAPWHVPIALPPLTGSAGRDGQLSQLSRLLERWRREADPLGVDLGNVKTRGGLRGGRLGRAARKQFERLREPLGRLDREVERCRERFAAHTRSMLTEEKEWAADDEEDGDEKGEGQASVETDLEVEVGSEEAARKVSRDSGYSSIPECGCTSSRWRPVGCTFAGSSRDGSGWPRGVREAGSPSDLHHHHQHHHLRQQQQHYDLLPPHLRHRKLSDTELSVLVTALTMALSSVVAIHGFLGDVVAAGGRTNTSLMRARVAETIDALTRQRQVLSWVLDGPPAWAQQKQQLQLLQQRSPRIGLPRERGAPYTMPANSYYVAAADGYSVFADDMAAAVYPPQISPVASMLPAPRQQQHSLVPLSSFSPFPAFAPASFPPAKQWRYNQPRSW